MAKKKDTNKASGWLYDLTGRERPERWVFPEPIETEADRERVIRDLNTYDLTTPEGRKAWKRAAPEGKERVICEDGSRWVEAVGFEVKQAAEAWLYGDSGIETLD